MFKTIIFTFAIALTTATGAHAQSMSWEDLKAKSWCSKSVCHGNDQGQGFRKHCDKQHHALPDFVGYMPLPSQQCLCPCSPEFTRD